MRRKKLSRRKKDLKRREKKRKIFPLRPLEKDNRTCSECGMLWYNCLCGHEED